MKLFLTFTAIIFYFQTTAQEKPLTIIDNLKLLDGVWVGKYGYGNGSLMMNVTITLKVKKGKLVEAKSGTKTLTGPFVICSLKHSFESPEIINLDEVEILSPADQPNTGLQRLMLGMYDLDGIITLRGDWAFVRNPSQVRGRVEFQKVESKNVGQQKHFKN